MNRERETEAAAEIIKRGGVVAFPTETYYGLAVDPFNPKALKKLFELKSRPENKPVLLLIAELGQLELLVSEIPTAFQPLVKLWPAALTLIFKAQPNLSPRLTAGSGTVGVRISPHPLAASLLKHAGRPITATSANLSGEEPATKPVEVEESFGRALDYLLDGGITEGGAPSTLVGLEAESPVLLRRGAFPVTRIERAIGGRIRVRN